MLNSKKIDKNQVVMLHRDGMRNSDIAKMVGCSPTYVANVLKEEKKSESVVEVDTGKVRALYNAGRSITWIADDMGLEPRIIGSTLKKLREEGQIA